MTLGNIEQLVVLAIVGWIFAIGFLIGYIQMYRMYLAESRRRHQYFIKILTFCEKTFKIMKDWHLEGGFICDDSFKHSFEMNIWEVNDQQEE